MQEKRSRMREKLSKQTRCFDDKMKYTYIFMSVLKQLILLSSLSRLIHYLTPTNAICAHPTPPLSEVDLGGASIWEQELKLGYGFDIVVGTRCRMMDMLKRGRLKLELCYR
jgi:hypothetical protein